MLDWLESTDVAGTIRSTPDLYALISAGHLLAIAALFGSVLVLDLALMGVTGHGHLAPLRVTVSRVARVALGFAGLTGLALFITAATDLAGNAAFQAKVCLIALTVGNALIAERALLACEAAVTPLNRWVGASSLLGWSGVIVLGRWIAFL